MLKLIFIIFCFASSFLRLPAQCQFEDVACWKETFDRKKNIDSTYWSYILGMRGKELEYYTNSSKNIYIKKGNLIIRALNEKKEKLYALQEEYIHEEKFHFYMVN